MPSDLFLNVTVFVLVYSYSVHYLETKDARFLYHGIHLSYSLLLLLFFWVPNGDPRICA